MISNKIKHALEREKLFRKNLDDGQDFELHVVESIIPNMININPNALAFENNCNKKNESNSKGPSLFLNGKSHAVPDFSIWNLHGKNIFIDAKRKPSGSFLHNGKRYLGIDRSKYDDYSLVSKYKDGSCYLIFGEDFKDGSGRGSIYFYHLDDFSKKDYTQKTGKLNVIYEIDNKNIIGSYMLDKTDNKIKNCYFEVTSINPYHYLFK